MATRRSLKFFPVTDQPTAVLHASVLRFGALLVGAWLATPGVHDHFPAGSDFRDRKRWERTNLGQSASIWFSSPVTGSFRCAFFEVRTASGHFLTLILFCPHVFQEPSKARRHQWATPATDLPQEHRAARPDQDTVRRPGPCPKDQSSPPKPETWDRRETFSSKAPSSAR